MKVLVGLSGGVDSAVAAYLLKKRGYEVDCCFMRNWDSALNNDTLGNKSINDDICPQEKDYLDALKVANKLGLKLLRSDYIKEYWDNVFRKFIDEYAKGRTPNPDILCNKYIKFDSFLNFALSKGYDMIATGHYFKADDENPRSYFKASDLNKDQSYFLAEVKKQALDKCLFPLSDITKDEVRKIAEELNLDNAFKKDSTGICFIGERNFKEFLKNYIPMKKGKVIDIDTLEIIGEHQGVYYYTIGQRKGFNIGGDKGPYYCCGKDVENNYLLLTSVNNVEYLYSNSCLVTNINWLKKPLDNTTIQAKFRYRQNDNEVTIKYLNDNEVMLYYPNKIKSVTIGQEAVFYDNGELLGGGVIDNVYLDNQDLNALFITKVRKKFNG